MSTSSAPTPVPSPTVILKQDVEKIHRRSKDGKEFHRKGGNDQDTVQIQSRDGKASVAAYCGTKLTVNARVNIVSARIHTKDGCKVLLKLKCYASYEDGMTRIFLITFKNEQDAETFVSVYNGFATALFEQTQDEHTDTLQEQEHEHEHEHEQEAGENTWACQKCGNQGVEEQACDNCSIMMVPDEGNWDGESESSDESEDDNDADNDADNEVPDEEDEEDFGPNTQDWPHEVIMPYGKFGDDDFLVV